MLVPALRTVGNIVTGDDMQTQMIINSGALGCLLHLLTSTQKKSIKKVIPCLLTNSVMSCKSDDCVKLTLFYFFYSFALVNVCIGQYFACLSGSAHPKNTSYVPIQVACQVLPLLSLRMASDWRPSS